MTRPWSPSDESIAETMILMYRKDYIDDELTIEEFEQKVGEVLAKAAKGELLHPPRFPPTWVCPWCHEKVAHSGPTFNWWCPKCGKNATDHANWNGVI